MKCTVHGTSLYQDTTELRKPLRKGHFHLSPATSTHLCIILFRTVLKSREVPLYSLLKDY